MRIVGRVRGVFGKHFLDMDELHMSCAKGVVRVIGVFRRLAQLEDSMPMTDKTLHTLEMEIKRIPGVRRVKLSNVEPRV